MPPIRVMHVIARMNVGGPAVEITELMRGLDPAQFEQTLVTGWCGDDEADYLQTQAPDIPAIRIDGLGRSIAPGYDALVLFRLIRLIREHRPDIVHTHTAKAGVLGRIAAKASGTSTRIIHTHHGHLLHGYFGPMVTRAVILTEKALAKITDRIITVGERVRDDLLKAGIGRPEQYEVIRSGVRLGPLPDRAQARAELGIPDDLVVISMIGRLTKIKRPDRFADVASILVSQGLPVTFLVAGGGDEEANLRARIEQEDLPITMLGWRSDLERILAATDIVLLTSDNEGTPLSLIQAGLAGIPVVATNVGSVHEIVKDRMTGFVVEGEPMALAEACATLIDDASMQDAYGRSALSYIDETFPITGFVTSHAGLYS